MWIPSKNDQQGAQYELVSLVGGKPNALEFVLVTTEDSLWKEQSVRVRRWVKAGVVRQEKQPPFDGRMLQRSRLLGDKQGEAIKALMKLRRQHPNIAPVAAQVEVESSFETEFVASEFDMPTFIEETWKWSEDIRRRLPWFGKGRV